MMLAKDYASGKYAHLLLVERKSRPTLLATSNGIQIRSAVFPQFTHQTDRPTDRQTNGPTDGKQ